MVELPKEIEQELQKDLAELEGKGSKKAAKKPAAKTAKPQKKPIKPEPVKKNTMKKQPTKETIVKEQPVKDAPPSKPATEQKPEAEDTRDDDARSRRIFYGGIVAIIILFAALLIGGKYLPSTTPSGVVTYNGYEFVKDATHWVFHWQKDGVTYTIPLRFNPKEAEQTRVEGVLDPRFNKLAPIYITFDPVSPESNFTYLTLGAGELSFNLVQALGKNITSACAVDDGTGVCKDREIINCENSKGKAVIFLKTAEPAGVFIQNTCIVLQGKEMELLRSIDRLLYDWYGIIQ